MSIIIGVFDEGGEFIVALKRYFNYMKETYDFESITEFDLKNIGEREIKCDLIIAVSNFLFTDNINGHLRKGMFVNIMEYIRYKRFLEIPVLFITSEDIEYLYLLSHYGLENQGFECASCGRGNIYLKMPFIMEGLIKKIKYGIKIGKEPCKKDNLIYLLHCQTKTIIP